MSNRFTMILPDLPLAGLAVYRFGRFSHWCMVVPAYEFAIKIMGMKKEIFKNILTAYLEAKRQAMTKEALEPIQKEILEKRNLSYLDLLNEKKVAKLIDYETKKVDNQKKQESDTKTEGTTTETETGSDLETDSEIESETITETETETETDDTETIDAAFGKSKGGFDLQKRSEMFGMINMKKIYEKLPKMKGKETAHIHKSEPIEQRKTKFQSGIFTTFTKKDKEEEKQIQEPVTKTRERSKYGIFNTFMKKDDQDEDKPTRDVVPMKEKFKERPRELTEDASMFKSALFGSATPKRIEVIPRKSIRKSKAAPVRRSTKLIDTHESTIYGINPYAFTYLRQSSESFEADVPPLVVPQKKKKAYRRTAKKDTEINPTRSTNLF